MQVVRFLGRVCQHPLALVAEREIEIAEAGPAIVELLRTQNLFLDIVARSPADQRHDSFNVTRNHSLQQVLGLDIWRFILRRLGFGEKDCPA